MKTAINKEEQAQVAQRICADVYSCMKIKYHMNIDDINYSVLLKVLEQHFDLHPFLETSNFMRNIDAICYSLHNTPCKYFNFTYKARK